MHKFLVIFFKRTELLIRTIRAYFHYFNHFLYDFIRYSALYKKTYPSENIETQLMAKIISFTT